MAIIYPLYRGSARDINARKGKKFLILAAQKNSQIAEKLVGYSDLAVYIMELPNRKSEELDKIRYFGLDKRGRNCFFKQKPF
jgi:hypothetical protein